jgi:hypothetical protein
MTDNNIFSAESLHKLQQIKQKREDCPRHRANAILMTNVDQAFQEVRLTTFKSLKLLQTRMIKNPKSFEGENVDLTKELKQDEMSKQDNNIDQMIKNQANAIEEMKT